ncbi:MAG TPA: hypothetical protein VFW66_04070 [Gemmatimonadales bacterium]|nr:hypothetical protein [Gemmatimonadales bacterium]
MSAGTRGSAAVACAASLAVACAALVSATACRGEPVQRPGDVAISRLVDSLKAPVERAAGLRFKSTPRSAMRSKAQVHDYLVRKLHEELPPERMHGVESTYRLFGLLPDTLELEPLLVNLYTEQVAGYYDPDSTTFFGVAGSDPTQLRLVLAHEMVHALQGQYLPLDSILHAGRSNDRMSAAQAVLEGQATLVSIRVLSPDMDVTALPGFWETYRSQVAQQQTAMPVFARAPLIVRETLLFPYLDGAEFMQWWGTSALKDTVPFGPRMPLSTEQIMHPDRYLAADRPVELNFTSGPKPTYEDGLGEVEIRVLEARLGGADTLIGGGDAIGWGGDRYRLYDTPAGPALVWYAVWDDAGAADRFARGPAARLAANPRRGYRAAADRLDVSGRPGVRLIVAPAAWSGWADPPRAGIASGGATARPG